MERKWWKERAVYQIYPRSFKDSNSDGIGDIRGIIEKLDYLKWLGIGAVWLCPVYDSPNYDMGYDIRNYEAIMTEFGSMSDFDELLAGLHERDIKLIMDLVVNHTSDEHRWFIESRQSKDNKYRDYYIWREGRNGAEPNNWASFFMPSAWTYDKTTGEWYLHLFSEKQPDLNWANRAVRNDLYSMINRWFDKGIDGFRMDVINFIAKDEGLPNAAGKPGEYVFADRYFANQPKLHEYLSEMRQQCFDGRDCMCVGETPCAGVDTAASLVDPMNRELDMLFLFDLVDIDSGPGGKWDVIPFDVMRFKKIMSSWQKGLTWNSLFLGNHDQPRPVSRYSNFNSEEMRVRAGKMLATAMYLQKGTPFIYQGEEIGMTNMLFKDASELRDVESINILDNAVKNGKGEEAWRAILKKGRDNARTPMQWNSGPNGGFTSGNPWIRVNPDYMTINVEAALGDTNSILHYYRGLLALRTSNAALIYGEYEEFLCGHEQVYAYKRIYGHETWAVLCNMTSRQAVINLPDEFTNCDTVLSNMNGDISEGKMHAYEARVLRFPNRI